MKAFNYYVRSFVLPVCLLAGCASPTGPAAHFRGTGESANVVIRPGHESVRCVAVLPFRAPTELNGNAVSDMFVTQILKMQKYDLIERSQLANVLGEAEVSLSGLTAGQAAQIGLMAGADAVIIGTVSEYETVAYRGNSLPVVGVSVRMIDANSGRILWSIDHAARGARGSTLAEHARAVVLEMVGALYFNLR